MCIRTKAAAKKERRRSDARRGAPKCNRIKAAAGEITARQHCDKARIAAEKAAAGKERHRSGIAANTA